MHELAHFTLHESIDNIEDENSDTYKIMEKETDLLAGVILLPKEALGEDISKVPLS